MNNLCTLLNNLSKNAIIAQQLDDLCNLVTAVVRDDLGNDSKTLITSWVQNNDSYIDFFFALRPDWLVGTPDDKQVKMRISIDTCDKSWYAYLVMDCQDGEIEAWGEKEFNRSELEEYSMPVKSMLETIHLQYDKKLHEENAKGNELLNEAVKVANLLAPHVDKIKQICKENGMKLFVDRSLDGMNSIYVVPDCVDTDDSIDEQDEIKIANIPYIDLNARGFDTNYDHFTKIK